MLTKLDHFFSQSKPISYRKGENIIRAEDTPQGVYYINKGYVRMFTILENGREITLNIFKPGSYFSMIWAIAEKPNRYFFQAMTPVVVSRNSKSQMIDLLITQPVLLFELTKRLLMGMDTLITQIEYMFSGRADQRINAALLLVAKRFGETVNGGGIRIQLPLTHHDIANLVGITRETASIFLKKLIKKNLISYQRRTIIITDPQRLAEEMNILVDENDSPQVL